MEREKSHWNENTPHVPSQVRRGNNTGGRMQVTGLERDERGCSSMWLWGFKLIEISDNYSKLSRHELSWSNKIIQLYSFDFLVLRQRFLSVFIREELGIKCNNFHFIFLFLTWLWMPSCLLWLGLKLQSNLRFLWKLENPSFSSSENIWLTQHNRLNVVVFASNMKCYPPVHKWVY